MTPEYLTKSLKKEALRLGFDFAAATPAVTPTGFNHLVKWLELGYAGEMHYFESRQAAYEHPKFVMDGVASLLVLGLNYLTEPAVDSLDGKGRIARYAWGEGDYHDLIQSRLKQLIKSIKAMDESIMARGVVDTAPLMEREFAQLAGIGWQAKNTMIINREYGSWFFLSAVLIDRQLAYDASFESNHCGTCTACLDACPTEAFIQPNLLNATRCISYLTIEHRSPIPHELREKMGDWLLGCDVCQDVCPWNNKAPQTREPAFRPQPDQNPIDLLPLFELDDESFRTRFRKTPMWRPKRRGILRNAAIALGNRPHEQAVEALIKGLNDEEPLVRGASAWALGKHEFAQAKHALLERSQVENDAVVSEEISLALEGK